jgi:3-dehydroquinate synthase
MRTVHVNLGARSYPVYIGPATRRVLRTIIDTRATDGRAVIIVDECVAKLHLDSLLEVCGPATAVLRVRPGEASKSLTVAAALYDALAEAHVERNDLIITFGGGVTGDLGGFVAATWLRGLRFVPMPTTLEAAVDASVGGKTGVNHWAGKNLIGAFHQPIAVIIDTDFLLTLPQRDFVAGLAESVKHALIRDSEFLGWHEAHVAAITARQEPILVELIARNCQIKADVVGQDEREDDLRAVLNFGHTVGHALEHLLGYELRHGECVALGMIAANEVACTRGLLDRATADRVRDLLARLGLPARLPHAVDAYAIVAACRMDKKVRGGTVNLVLIRNVGQTIRVSDVLDDEIVGAVQAVLP